MFTSFPVSQGSFSSEIFGFVRVSSYEFSEKATVEYIDSMWYTQKVDFKKDFIAKIGLYYNAI
jgi:hypothetical protein